MLNKIGLTIRNIWRKPEKTKEEPKRFVPNQRVGKESMTDEEILRQGFNGSTYSINGRDVDF
tara:strand:- start:153 stop:338 length:186 start_codon:yes stop_codon:yes gene_type:complete